MECRSGSFSSACVSATVVLGCGLSVPSWPVIRDLRTRSPRSASSIELVDCWFSRRLITQSSRHRPLLRAVRFALTSLNGSRVRGREG